MQCFIDEMKVDAHIELSRDYPKNDLCLDWLFKDRSCSDARVSLATAHLAFL